MNIRKKFFNYVYLFPLILAFLSLIGCSLVIKKYEQYQFEDLLKNKKEIIDLVAYNVEKQIEIDQDWPMEKEYYKFQLRIDIEEIDSQDMVYASMYDSDLNLISNRTPSIREILDPMTDFEFVEKVRYNNLGEHQIWFNPQGEKARTIYLYYRWVPIEKDDNYLLVVGVSKMAMKDIEQIEMYISGLVFFVLVSNMAIIVLLKHAVSKGKLFPPCVKNC